MIGNKMIDSRVPEGANPIKCFALTLLTTTIASTEIAPMAFAATDVDQLRRKNLDPDADHH